MLTAHSCIALPSPTPTFNVSDPFCTEAGGPWLSDTEHAIDRVDWRPASQNPRRDRREAGGTATHRRGALVWGGRSSVPVPFRMLSNALCYALARLTPTMGPGPSSVAAAAKGTGGRKDRDQER